MINHPLHLAVADALEKHIGTRAQLLRDPACGGTQHLPLFVGPRRGRDTRMCLVDLLVVASGRVKVIVEIEESGFLPTKICGKFLQATLATYFIHDSQELGALPYADDVLFVQVLDGSKCLKEGTRKDAQGRLIEEQIRERLPLPASRIGDYRLFFVAGAGDESGLASVAETVARSLG